jgi:hypothetical protein
MDFPDKDVAMGWLGRTVVDRDGTEIGACTGVFLDDGTQLTEWVCSEVDGVAVFIPAVGATESTGNVQVAVSRSDVTSAPAVGDAQHISAEEEAALYRHYGIPHSREASPTLLPTGDVEQPTEAATADTASDAGSDDAADAAPDTPPDAAARIAGDAAADTATGPVPATEPAQPMPAVGEAAVPRTQLASDAGQDRSGDRVDSTGGRRRIGLAAAGLAAVGSALGVAMRVRQLRRRRPPTRRERLAARRRAATAALSAGTGQVARQVARHRLPVGAVAGGVPAAAALAAAMRRRRSREEPHD